MRTTNNMLINNMIYYMTNNLERLSKYQTQLATGKKMQVPSDDPVAAARALKLRTDVSEIAQFKSNSNDAYSWMDTTETALAKIGDILQVARERAVQAANGTLTPEDREKIKQELEQLKKQIVHVANTSYAGRYIFSGFSTDMKLMNEDGTYAISVASRNTAIIKSGLIKLDPSASIDTSVNNAFEISLDGVNYYRVQLGSGIIYDGTSPGSTLDDLAKEIQDSISLATPVDSAPAVLPDEMRNIRVINNDGRIEFSLDVTTDKNGNPLKIFLREPSTGTDNLLKSINIKTEGIPGIRVSQSEDIRYQVGIGDLIEVNVPGTELFGPGIKGQTCDFIQKIDKFIDALENPYHVANEGLFASYSNPVDLTANNTFNIKVGNMGDFETITLTPKIYDGTPGNTLDDLAKDIQNCINSNPAVIAAGVSVTVVNKGGRLVIADKNGAEITLQQNPPNDALSALNFKTDASGFVTSISSQDGINAAIEDMQSNLDKLLSIRSDIGARMNRIELTLNRLDSDEINFTKLMSNNEDVDIAEVIMKLMNEENVYKASLAGGARIIQPTLVDFLR